MTAAQQRTLDWLATHVKPGAWTPTPPGVGPGTMRALIRAGKVEVMQRAWEPFPVYRLKDAKP